MITLEPPRGVPEGADGWRALGLSRSSLVRFLRKAQALSGLRGELSVLLAPDAVLKRLNLEYRAQNKATDVLSFPAPAELGDGHAGDLAISVETAARQAARLGHSLQDEIRILLLHGLLHLGGMDHEVDTGEMAKREADLRAELKLPNSLIARTSAPPSAQGPRRKVAAR